MEINQIKDLYYYIEESVEVCKQNIDLRKELTQKLVKAFIESKATRITMIASGSSYNAALSARLFMEKMLDCEVKICTPFQFTHYEQKIDEHEFVLAITQSGKSSNTIEAVEKCNRLNRPIHVLTGNIQSTVSQLQCDVYDFGVGEEIIEFVTKGYITTILYLCLFALESALAKKLIVEEKYLHTIHEMENINLIHYDFIEQSKLFIASHMKEILSSKRIQICGYGPNYATAIEGALKISEVLSFAATGYDSEEYLHGPYLETTNECAVFLLDSDGVGSQRCKHIYESLTCLTNKRYLITRQGDVSDKHQFIFPHSMNEFLSPILYISFYQILTSMIAKERNIVDQSPQSRVFEEYVKSKI